MNNEDRLAALLSKANDLPLSSGVYIMKDKNGKVIYVGKSKKLKNRVSQYFRGGHKNLKTQRMVMSVHDFDVIFVDSEIEALTLENTLIKKHSPRYNIKLKDAKSYPYIKVELDSDYPRITMTRKRESDRAKYFGPYSGTADVYRIIDMLNKTLRLATCKREFPRDIGKMRPCIYKQMNRCLAPCTGEVTPEQYRSHVREAIEILRGNVT
ncbi:MAG: GIY-YIG nuclease family protein, partial [Clostridia bacterium]|nr:GIY-YIG nuclease family protein [Clostridia bacterium]